MYLPIYAKGAAPETAEQRRNALRGWVSARFTWPMSSPGSRANLNLTLPWM